MAQWTLLDIREKVRKVTGRFTENEMQTSDLDKRINQYYQLRFPAEVKLEKQHTFYEFLTQANQSYYAVPESTYTNFEPPATVNNLDILWYQNPTKFEQDNLTSALQYVFATPWTGDGSTLTFSTTVTGFPIMPATVTITDNIETFWDQSETWTTSNVSVTGSAGGIATINYNTGSISVTFNVAPANGQSIYLNYVVFKAGRPQAILYYNSKFQLLPPPDQSYIIKMSAYRVVNALSLATDRPHLDEWGPAIAYGTALGIFADYGENDAYVETTALHKQQLSLIMTRTCQDLMNTRAMPNF